MVTASVPSLPLDLLTLVMNLSFTWVVVRRKSSSASFMDEDANIFEIVTVSGRVLDSLCNSDYFLLRAAHSSSGFTSVMKNPPAAFGIDSSCSYFSYSNVSNGRDYLKSCSSFSS